MSSSTGGAGYLLSFRVFYGVRARTSIESVLSVFFPFVLALVTFVLLFFDA